MKKCKFFLSYEKEEKWLEYMASQGYQLKKKGYTYMFESAPPAQANIRIDYRKFKKQRDFEDYCSSFQKSGWRHIAGTKKSGTQYFTGTSANINKDIFSGTALRAGRYKRLSDMFLSNFVIFFVLFIGMGSTEALRIDGLLNPKSLYYTSGLWDMSGSDFWRHFLFETPFAILRGSIGIIWILFILSYAFFGIRSWVLYKKALGSDHR